MIAGPVIKRYEYALHYPTYRLVARSSQYAGDDGKIIAKWASRLQAQMRSNLFNAFDPISVIRYLSVFKWTCDTNINHGGATI